MQRPSTWVLTYSRLGDNNQALALARSLGRPFETKKLRYNWLRHFGLHFGPSFITLDRASRDSLQAPWPELVISIGRFSVPVARAIKARSGGRTKTIFLGNPRVDPRHFDLVFATRDYLRPRGPNVVVLPLPMGLPVEKHAEAGWAMGLPHPRTLLLIGASIKYWELTPASIASMVEVLADRANKARGSLLVSGSPRTPDAVLLAAENALARANDGWMSPSRKGGLAAMLDAADEVVVTGDSMSMVTDAVLTGKPVGIVPLELSERGRNKLGPSAAAEGSRSKRRDMRRFWADLWAKGLAGTAAQPKAATIASSAAAAALLVASYMNVAQSPEMVDEPIPAAAPAPSMLRAILSFASLAGTLVDRAQQDAGALWLATWEPETPWYVKLIAGTTSISALSPVDLTPDVIPVIGYMDDLLLLTIGMLLTARLIPKPLMAQLRERAVSVDFTNARRGALAVCGLWLASAAAAVLRASGLF